MAILHDLGAGSLTDSQRDFAGWRRAPAWARLVINVETPCLLLTRLGLRSTWVCEPGMINCVIDCRRRLEIFLISGCKHGSREVLSSVVCRGA